MHQGRRRQEGAKASSLREESRDYKKGERGGKRQARRHKKPSVLSSNPNKPRGEWDSAVDEVDIVIRRVRQRAVSKEPLPKRKGGE